MKMEQRLYNGIQLEVITNFGNFKKKYKVFTELVLGLILLLKSEETAAIYILTGDKNTYGEFKDIFQSYDLLSI